MLDREDHRWRLVPPPGANGLYLHRVADRETEDSVAGPISGYNLNARVERTYEGQTDFLREGFIRNYLPYELPDLKAQHATSKIRAEIDKLIRWAGPAPLELTAVYVPILKEIEFALSNLFARVICSMTRIVISAYRDNEENWVAVTVRDKEKLVGLPVDVVYVRAAKDGFEWRGPASAVPSSSSISAYTFHQCRGAEGALVHTHGVFPVLFDDVLPGVAQISVAPRLPSFGEELCRQLEGNRTVLRRNEGTWAFGMTAEAAVEEIIWHQGEALDRIWDE